jgi:hypothetical protein
MLSGVPYRWLQIALDSLRGIEPYEVMQALRAIRRLPVPGHTHGITVLGVLARTAAGRPILVAIHTTDDRDHQIIGARDMTPEELATFEQWEATQ